MIEMEGLFKCPHCGQYIDADKIAKYFAARGGRGNTYEHMIEISKLAAKKRTEKALKDRKKIAL